MKCPSALSMSNVGDAGSNTRSNDSRKVAGSASQLDVAAVAVGGVRGPALKDAVSAVGLTDIVPSVAGIGDQVDPFTDDNAVRRAAYRCSRMTACSWA